MKIFYGRGGEMEAVSFRQDSYDVVFGSLRSVTSDRIAQLQCIRKDECR